MTIEEAVARGRELLEDVSFSNAKMWKESHGEKVAGCFQVYTPQELVHAAGMLPVGLMGAGDKVETDHADALIQSFVCSICRSTLELGLTGRLEVFDYLIFPSICDVARNLSGIFQRNFPQTIVDFLHLPQNVQSTGAVDYLKSEYLRVLRSLEQVSGRKVTSAALNRSIQIFNENRRLLRQVYALRKEKPWLLSAYESYILERMGSLLPREEHTSLLGDIIKDLPERKVREKDYVRVILEGSFCEQPPLELIRSMEEAGCYIVDDDFLVGYRWFEADTVVDGDPLQRMAESYVHRSVLSSVRHEKSLRSEVFLKKIRSTKSHGVVFCTPKFCEPALDDLVLYKEALEKARIPYLHIEYEEKMGAFDNARSQIETFVESILFD